MKSMRSGLARARGLGAAGSGTETFWRQRVTSARSCAKSADAADGSARMTTSAPRPTPGRASAQTAFSRRRTVLRVTAPPTCLLTMKPNRAGRSSADAMT